MRGRQQIKQAVQFFFRGVGNQLVDFLHRPAPVRVALFHIQDQCFEQIHLCAVPKVVAPLAAGILDNHIAKKLRHQLVALDLRQAGPGIRRLRRNEVKHPDDISLFVPQIAAGGFIQFGFRIADNQRFSLRCRLQDAVDAIGSCFHTAAGAVHGHIFIKRTLLRYADILSVQRAENGAVVFFYAGCQIQHFLRFLFGHKAGCTIRSLARINEIAVFIIFAGIPIAHPHHHDDKQCQDANTNEDADDPIRHGKHGFKVIGQSKRRHGRRCSISGCAACVLPFLVIADELRYIPAAIEQSEQQRRQAKEDGK